HNGPTGAIDSHGLQKKETKTFELSFITESGPRTGTYGARVWAIDWRIKPDSDPKHGGMIVQWMEISRDYKSNDGKKPVKYSSEYFEVWEVEPGKRTAVPKGYAVSPTKENLAAWDARGVPLSKDIRANDWWGGLPPINTNGSIVTTGKAVYYDCMTT